MDARYLVRRFSGGIENWLKEHSDINVLAKNAFDLADGEQSVYEVADGEEECLAVAAHKLTAPKISPAPIVRLVPFEAEMPFPPELTTSRFLTVAVMGDRWLLKDRAPDPPEAEMITFDGVAALPLRTIAPPTAPMVACRAGA